MKIKNFIIMLAAVLPAGADANAQTGGDLAERRNELLSRIKSSNGKRDWGLNEYTNGLVRQSIPEKQGFHNILMTMKSNLSRKSLNFDASIDSFYKKLHWLLESA
jgi:hypothetical protein